MGCCSVKCSVLTIFSILGILFLLIGLTAFFVPKILVNKLVREQTFLGRDANGTDNLVLKMFRDPPYDVKLQVWTFSIQNAEDVVNNGKKPIIIEKGPYTYNVILHKTNVSFAANDTRLFFRNGKTYFFNASQSCANCKLDDPVIFPNIVYQKILDIYAEAPPLVQSMLKRLINKNEKIFINKSVDELLFKGYEDPLIEKFCDHWYTRPLCKKYNIPLRIGLFYGQNQTDDGLYEVDTGLKNVNDLDKVYSWNNMTGKLDGQYWYNETARMINGTDAELYKPNLYNGENLQIFIGQLCRSFDLVKRGTAITSDIPVFRYGQPDSFLNVDVQRAQGFCNPGEVDYFHNASIQQADCAPSGLLDMSSCLPGNMRIYWSASHFRNAPPELRFPGMYAPSEDDSSFFDIEPITGVVVGVQQRSQLNLGMLNRNVAQKTPDMIVPLIWINESAIIDPATKAQLKLPLEVIYYSFTIGLGLMVGGTLCLIIFVGTFIGYKIAERNREISDDPRTPLINAEQPEPVADFLTPQPQDQQQQHHPVPNFD